MNLRVCQPAAEALGKFGDLRAVAPLIKVLSDGDSNASFCAARALTTFGVEIAIQPLIKALTGASWYACRKTAAELLGQLRDIRAVEPLVRALVDADADVPPRWLPWRWVIWGIHSGGPLSSGMLATGNASRSPVMHRALALLSEALQCHDREPIAKVLGDLGDPLAAEPLIQALVDHDPTVRTCRR